MKIKPEIDFNLCEENRAPRPRPPLRVMSFLFRRRVPWSSILCDFVTIFPFRITRAVVWYTYIRAEYLLAKLCAACPREGSTCSRKRRVTVKILFLLLRGEVKLYVLRLFWEKDSRNLFGRRELSKPSSRKEIRAFREACVKEFSRSCLLARLHTDTYSYIEYVYSDKEVDFLTCFLHVSF